MVRLPSTAAPLRSSPLPPSRANGTAPLAAAAAPPPTHCRAKSLSHPRNARVRMRICMARAADRCASTAAAAHLSGGRTPRPSPHAASHSGQRRDDHWSHSVTLALASQTSDTSISQKQTQSAHALRMRTIESGASRAVADGPSRITTTKNKSSRRSQKSINAAITISSNQINNRNKSSMITVHRVE